MSVDICVYDSVWETTEAISVSLRMYILTLIVDFNFLLSVFSMKMGKL